MITVLKPFFDAEKKVTRNVGDVIDCGTLREKYLCDVAKVAKKVTAKKESVAKPIIDKHVDTETKVSTKKGKSQSAGNETKKFRATAGKKK